MSGQFWSKLLRILKKHYSSVVFIGLFVFLASEFNYQETMFFRPQSTHAWRQTDCGSFALNYYRDGLNPFKPRMHNELGGEGKSIGEGPVLYYTAAILYNVFGYHEWLFRTLNTFILFLGLWFLFKLIVEFTKDVFWAVSIPLLLFTFPLIIFYGNTFMPNVPSLGLALIAWFWFYKFTQKPTLQLALLSSMFFLLAGWIKAPALVSYLALIGVGALYLIFDKKTRQTFKLKLVWPFIIPIVFNACWYAFSAWYANHINSNYLSAKIFPYWKLTNEEIAITLVDVKVIWLQYIVYSEVLKVSIIALLASIPFFYIKQTRFLWSVVWLTFIGFLGYFLIFFAAFRYHDYYLVNATILAPLIMLLFTQLLKVQQVPKVFSWALKVGVVFLLVNAVKYGSEKQNDRYHAWLNDYLEVPKAIFNMEPILTQWGISEDEKIISIPDPSPNMSLYYLNRRGYTNINFYTYAYFNFEYAYKHGVKYVVVLKPEAVEELNLKPFLGDLIGSYEGITAYKLKAN